jgi:hypothetical protein
MKKLFLLSNLVLIVALGGNNSVFAQVVIVAKQLSVTDDASKDEFIAKGKLKNTGAATTVTWKRVKNQIPTGWFSAGCDKVKCYFPEVSTGSFTMDKDEEAIMEVYFYPQGIDGEGIVELEISTPSGIVDTIVAVGRTTGFATGLSFENYAGQADFKIFNENDGFRILAEKALTMFVLDLNGKIHSTAKLSSGEHFYSTAGLSPGLYIVSINSSKIRIIVD